MQDGPATATLQPQTDALVQPAAPALPPDDPALTLAAPTPLPTSTPQESDLPAPTPTTVSPPPQPDATVLVPDSPPPLDPSPPPVLATESASEPTDAPQPPSPAPAEGESNVDVQRDQAAEGAPGVVEGREESAATELSDATAPATAPLPDQGLESVEPHVVLSDSTPAAEPSPSALDSSPAALAVPAPTSSNPSRSSTPTLGLSHPPPPPSSSPVPAPKKFASSLSVNKKFLEKAGEKGKPDVKATVARLATPPIVAPLSTSHPRLLTGKISAVTSIPLTTAQTVAGVSGWLKNLPGAGDTQPRPPLASQDATAAGRGGAYERGRGGLVGGQLGRGRGAAVWGGKGSATNGELNMGMGGDFPTAAEAANAKILRAAALLEQMQSRDRAVQARAAAAAAANAHLLEGLDAFRGVHLDPNASHWDEMGDEDTDFLDDTIEFGDGTQYKIEEPVHLPTRGGPSSSHDHVHFLEEPHPTDFATLEAPLAAGESGAHEGSREERFKDDYDRSWPKRPIVGDAKNLFNERLGKFELYAGTGQKPAPGSILGHGAPAELPHRPSGSDHSSLTSPRLERMNLPPQVARPAAWGRDAPRGGEWGHAAGSGPAPRRPSIEQQRMRRPSNEPMARRPSIVEQGGRQLPPHLAGGAALPSRGVDHHDQPHSNMPPVVHHPFSHPPSHLPLAPSHSHFPTQPHPRPIPPPAAVLSPTQPSQALPPISPSALPAVESTPAAPPPPVVDLEEMHAREMHAAAERARKRRQEEEELRAAQAERAKKKATELEEKMRLAAEAKAKEAAAAAPPPPPASERPVVNDPSSRPAPNGVPESSWRKPVVSKPAPPPAPAPVPPPPHLSRPDPTSILTRDPKPQVASQERPPNASPTAPRPPALAAKVPTSAPVEEQERVWRRASSISAPPTRPNELSRAPSNRQLPPHLAEQAPATSSLPPPVPADVAPPPTAPLPDQHASFLAAVTAPPVSSIAPDSSTAGAASARKGVAGPLAIKGAFKKVPPISTLEDTMSRIKGAMALPKEPVPDASETLSRESNSPVAIPTVKLPTTILSSAPLAQPPTVPAPSSLPAPPKPARVADARSPRPPPAAKPTPTGPRGRPETTRKGGHLLPLFDSREAMPLFDRTRVERSHSPPPAWKAYNVSLAAYEALSRPRPKPFKGFTNPHEPARVQSLSWNPPLPARLVVPNSLIPRPFFKGKPIIPVNVPTIRIVRKTEIEVVRVETLRAVREEEAPRTSESYWRRGDASNGTDQGFDENPMQMTLDATTAPSAASLFDAPPPLQRAAPPTPTPAPALAPVATPVKSKLPPGESIAFYRSPTDELLQLTDAAPTFTVTSELNGEVVAKSPGKSLAAPGADVTPQPLDHESTSVPSFDPTDAPASQTFSPPASAAWANNKTPLTMSVLDPTAPSVWSAPPNNDSPVHARSISLGGPQPENSLQGIADPDDFLPSSIPTSLAELKSEDEGSADGKPVVQKQAAKDEARLRAAAPAFSSHSHQELPTPHAEAYAPRYPGFSRTPSYSQLQHQPSQSPIGYASPFPPVAYGQQQQQQPQFYPFSSIPSQPTPQNYLTMHQGYQQGAFAPSLQQQQPQLAPQLGSPVYQNAYRQQPGGAITNPALIAAYGSNTSYGPVGAASAFGPVGGSSNPGAGFARSPSMAPSYLPAGAYGNGGVRTAYGNGMGQQQQVGGYGVQQQQQDARGGGFGVAGGGYAAGGYLQQPQQGFTGFSPQQQAMRPPGGQAVQGFRRY